MRVAGRHVLGLAACLALAGCGRDNQAEIDELMRLTPLDRFLASVYDPANRATSARESGPWDDVCAKVDLPDARMLVAVCHVVNESEDSNWVDLFLLANADGTVRQLARGRHPTGAVDLDIDVARIGRDRYAFVLDEQGGAGATSEDSMSTRVFLAFDGTGLKPVAAFRGHFWHACRRASYCGLESDKLRADYLRFDHTIDARQPDREAYPLLVHEYGTECELAIDRRHRLEFDAATFAYAVPADLMRDPQACPDTSPFGGPLPDEDE